MLKPNGNKITKKELSRFLYASLPSGKRNNDGYGAFWEHDTYKNTNEFKDEDVKKLLKLYKGNSRYYVFHTRLATSPVNMDNTHPFKLNGFIGVHNGVVTVPKYDLGVDSLNMFKAIEETDGKYFSNKIKNVMKNVTGSYSVLIYHKNNDCFYYYRNNPKFNFMLNAEENIIYGATDIDRLRSLRERRYNYFEVNNEETPLPNMIYCINVKTGRFSHLGRFKNAVERTRYRWEVNDSKTGGDVQTNFYGHQPYRYDSDSYGSK